MTTKGIREDFDHGKQRRNEMKTTITLTEEQKERLSSISVSAAETLCEILGIRFVIENGKVEALEL